MDDGCIAKTVEGYREQIESVEDRLRAAEHQVGERRLPVTADAD
jgi:hypothetical protein